MKADGDAVPQPRPYEQLRHNPDFVQDSADAIVTMVSPKTEMAAAQQSCRVSDLSAEARWSEGGSVPTTTSSAFQIKRVGTALRAFAHLMLAADRQRPAAGVVRMTE